MHIPLYSSVSIVNIIYCARDSAYLISTSSAAKREEKGSIFIFTIVREKPKYSSHQDQEKIFLGGLLKSTEQC